MTTLIKRINCPRLNQSGPGGREIFVQFVERKECECESGKYFPRTIMCDEYNSETKKCKRKEDSCIYSKWKNL